MSCLFVTSRECLREIHDSFVGWLNPVNTERLSHDVQLGAPADLGELLKRLAGRREKRSLVDRETYTARLNQGMIDIP